MSGREATAAGLEAAARAADEQLAQAPAEDVLRWAVDRFGSRVCVTSSMTDGVLAHLAGTVAPGMDVLFLDTGYHFAETLGTRDAVAASYPVNVVSVTPERSVAEQDREHGPRLHDRDPDACCRMRKVEPLARALADYDAWVTGLRRDESAERADTPVVGWDPRRGKVKVNPLARWTAGDVAAYIDEHGVLVNPLRAAGYPSVGCAPCTRAVAPGDDERAGRWAGSSKTECGLHS